VPDDREERHIKAFIESLRRAVQADLPDEDVGRLAAAALGDRDADQAEGDDRPPGESTRTPAER